MQITSSQCGSYLQTLEQSPYRSISSIISIYVKVVLTSLGCYHYPSFAIVNKYYSSSLMPQPVVAEVQKILSNFPYFQISDIRLLNFLRLSTKSILFKTRAFMKLGYYLCFYNLMIDSLIMLSNLLALSTTRRVKSISESTFHPFEINPSFLYINPGVSKYLSCMFFIPASLSLSKDLTPCTIQLVVAAFADTALTGWDRDPKSCDLPALTGPISPILRAQEF